MLLHLLLLLLLSLCLCGGTLTVPSSSLLRFNLRGALFFYATLGPFFLRVRSVSWIWNPDVNEATSPWSVTASPAPVSYCGNYEAPYYLCNPFWIIDGTEDVAPFGGDGSRWTAYDYAGMSGPPYYFTVDFGSGQTFSIWRFSGSGSCNYGFTTAELQIEIGGAWTTIAGSSLSGAESDIVDGWSISSDFVRTTASKVRGKIIDKASCSSNSGSIYQVYAKGFNIGLVCEAGEHMFNSSCIDCPAGEYQDQTGQTSCNQCNAGQYQDQTGQTSCNSCPANSNSLTTGQSGCDCVIGFSSSSGYADGSTTCVACNAGEYQDQTGQTSCNQCNAGEYQDQTGQASCSQCNAGEYQDQTGQTSCNQCNAGEYQDNVGQASCLSPRPTPSPTISPTDSNLSSQQNVTSRAEGSIYNTSDANNGLLLAALLVIVLSIGGGILIVLVPILYHMRMNQLKDSVKERDRDEMNDMYVDNDANIGQSMMKMIEEGLQKTIGPEDQQINENDDSKENSDSKNGAKSEFRGKGYVSLKNKRPKRKGKSTYRIRF